MPVPAGGRPPKDRRKSIAAKMTLVAQLRESIVCFIPAAKRSNDKADTTKKADQNRAKLKANVEKLVETTSAKDVMARKADNKQSIQAFVRRWGPGSP